jgi:benzoyl-CoA reductase/2-hydroxyglutaryl-CoA dehydratase subunit BcrC/BadD/HgdB
MIIRILGEGQLAVDDSLATELNELDARLEAAVNSGDENAFRPVLAQMLDRVRAVGTPVPADSLESSDVILPYSGATMEDVRGLLSEDGLIPGR